MLERKMTPMAVLMMLAIAGLTPVLFVPPVLAGQGKGVAPTCEIKQVETDGARIHVAGDWELECRAGRGCAIRGPEVNGHRMQLSHELGKAHWNVVLTMPEGADAQAGVELVVDAGEPMRIPYEFLRVAAAGRVIGIRPEVVDIVLEALGGGKRLEWRYLNRAGKAVSVSFDIACLGPGGLLPLAKRSLAEMRAMNQLGK